MNIGDVNWVEFPPRNGLVKALWSALDEITGRIEISS